MAVGVNDLPRSRHHDADVEDGAHLACAVIALQIAVGSRPPDLRWDVSGDKRVTSLDALMILQAAAGGTGIG